MAQAKSELADWLAPIEAQIDSLLQRASTPALYLTKRQAVGLAGEWYQKKTESDEATFTDSTMPWDWDDTINAIVPDDHEEGDALRPIPAIVEARDALMIEKGLNLDPESAGRLLQAMLVLYLNFLRLMQRRVAGDFGHDPVLDTLPPVEAHPTKTPKAGATLSIKGLFEEYAATGTARAHTVAKWRVAISAFVDHAGHDNAKAVTRGEVSAWLQSLVAGGLSVKTVTGTYRAALARVLSRGHNDGRLKENAAARMEVIGQKATQTRRKDISDDEAKVILKAALAPQSDGLSEHYALARRWAHWICAYTGARINEITQMRACDILKVDGVWVFRITPDAGSVKNEEFRLAPVHSHLIEQGVLNLAKAGDDTPLFYDPAAARKRDAVQKQPQQVGSKLAAWVRELGVTEVLQPNHGWRHRFKTVARTVGIPAEERDAIQGHAPRTEADRYGKQPPAVLQAAVEKLPRYEW
jgi:integrase